MTGNNIRLILPVVYLSGDELLDPNYNESTPPDFTSAQNFAGSLQQDPTLLTAIQQEFPFVEAIDPFWLLQLPVYRVTLSIDPTATYPARPYSTPEDSELVPIALDQLWVLAVGNGHAFFRLLNRIFYTPEGSWNGITGRFAIPLVLSDDPGAAQTAINFLMDLYEWPDDGGVRLGRQGGGGP